MTVYSATASGRFAGRCRLSTFLGEGGPLFVNTLFNRLGTVSEGYCFHPLWRPPFISRLAAED